MTELRFKLPCNDCPFRRNSLAGWTGSAEPEWFTGAALSDYPNDCPCHQTVDYEDPDWKEDLEDASVCVGALIFARNCGKLPRDPEASAMVMAVEQNKEAVFTHSQEFIDHHRQREGVGSWLTKRPSIRPKTPTP